MWSADGSHILGIRETDDLHLNVVSLSLDKGKETVLADLGRSFAFNNAVKGLTLIDDGQSALTSIIRPHGTLWVAEGLRWRTWMERTFPKSP